MNKLKITFYIFVFFSCLDLQSVITYNPIINEYRETDDEGIVQFASQQNGIYKAEYSSKVCEKILVSKQAKELFDRLKNSYSIQEIYAKNWQNGGHEKHDK